MGDRSVPVAHGRSPAKSAARVLDIIEALATSSGDCRFTELRDRLGLPKSSLHELLSVLTDRGYVRLDPRRGTYSLGIRVWEAGQAFVRHRDLEREARPAMEAVVAEINETVQLAVLDGAENVYLAKVDCSHPLRLQSEVGKRLPAYATGLGKVLLAHLPAEEVAVRLGTGSLPRYTERTIVDGDRLGRELATIRERGFALDDQEYTPGLRCVAVPVLDLRGEAVAALSASIPIMRADADRLALALRALAAASAAISRRLGSVAPDPRLARLATVDAGPIARALSEEQGPNGMAAAVGAAAR